MGIGFVLLQRTTDSDGEWKTIQAGSRFLTDTEMRYTVSELECLAVAWAVKKCQIFLSGLTVVTDQNPLVPILNTHRLDKIKNPHLQCAPPHVPHGVQLYCKVTEEYTE